MHRTVFVYKVTLMQTISVLHLNERWAPVATSHRAAIPNHNIHKSST
jgi:hypothetical protein